MEARSTKLGAEHADTLTLAVEESAQERRKEAEQKWMSKWPIRHFR